MPTTTTIAVPFDAEKLSALRQYAAKKNVSVEDELAEFAAKLYDKLVPSAVREYIGNKPQTVQSSRPSRAANTRNREPTGGSNENSDA